MRVVTLIWPWTLARHICASHGSRALRSLGNLGQTEKAAGHLQDAQTFIDAVVARQPGNRIVLLRSAQVAHDRMIVAGQRGQPDEAFRFAGVSGQRLERYLATGPIDPGEAEQVVIVYMNVANRYMMAGRHDEAIRMARKTIAIADATKQPAQAGAALTVVARRRAGLRTSRRGAGRRPPRGIARVPSAGAHTTVTRRLVYALALIREAAILGGADSMSLGRPAEAVPLLQEAFAVCDDAAEHDPAESNSRLRLATAGLELAPLLRDLIRAAALEVYDHILRHAGEVKNNTIAPA